MKLYYYEHCPFSARVRMALNLKEIEAERIVLLADDERTLAALIGKHQIPVLVRDDGTPMTESLEIVRHLDALDGRPRIDPQRTPALDAWLALVVPAMQYLGYPRWTRIGLAEFATPEAYEHFRAKKTHSIGDFGEAVANTGARAAELTLAFTRLPALMRFDAPRDPLTMDDFILAPMLRSLSVVKAVAWPLEVRRYTEAVCARTGLDTFFDRAL